MSSDLEMNILTFVPVVHIDNESVLAQLIIGADEAIIIYFLYH